MKKIFSLFLLFFSSIIIFGQTKRALFLGNSYTYVNNLPLLIATIATSMNDTLVYDSNTPGGQSLLGHSTDPNSLNKIALGNWDYVILQDQSQAPSLPPSQIATDVFPPAHYLDSVIRANNPCGESVFFMTWGRKNGDAQNCVAYPLWQYICTYNGMDSLLNLRYRMLADSNAAIVSPVGAVWHLIRQNYPSIELYDLDEAHPSLAGSYAAACCFYTTLFQKDPTLITFNSTLSTTDANNIKLAAKQIVFDSLMNWHIGEYDSINNTNCLASSIKEYYSGLKWKAFPNPTSSILNIEFFGNTIDDQIQIYNSIGDLVMQVDCRSNNKINIASLSNGIYLVHLKHQPQYSLKFVKE